MAVSGTNPVQAHEALAAIQLQPPQPLGSLDRSGGRPGAAGDGPDAGDQLPEPERFDHIVVGPQLQPEDPVNLLGAGRDDDDRHRRAGPQLAAHVDAVHVG